MQTNEIGASTAVRSIILSLQPTPYGQMLAGSKKYEFRRKFMKAPVRAFIYVSSPVKAIRAYVEFDAPIVDAPERLGRLAEQEGTGTIESIVTYFAGLEQGYALPVRTIREIEPMPLEELRDAYRFTAPQSYCRLSAYPGLGHALFKRLHETDKALERPTEA
ncbi:hypothetical protein [Paenibacillus methanolicus]|uniref:Putative transcriptional regulator n=1 Tax=Paenibacillus methanolicus TaxID=582686 RepID=A0A5S5CJ88_9BACL|nr:hypothetical protein [Paenibacillus methanolicus]TYP79849.1 putative transcriptional regulator [Paenibacillus methanolicus]